MDPFSGWFWVWRGPSTGPVSCHVGLLSWKLGWGGVGSGVGLLVRPGMPEGPVWKLPEPTGGPEASPWAGSGQEGGRERWHQPVLPLMLTLQHYHWSRPSICPPLAHISIDSSVHSSIHSLLHLLPFLRPSSLPSQTTYPLDLGTPILSDVGFVVSKKNKRSWLSSRNSGYSSVGFFVLFVCFCKHNHNSKRCLSVFTINSLTKKKDNYICKSQWGFPGLSDS